MQKVLFTILSIFALFLSAPYVEAQVTNQTTTFTGSVLAYDMFYTNYPFAKDSPTLFTSGMPDVNVSAIDSRGRTVGRTKTDASGRFSFSLKAGVYRFKADFVYRRYASSMTSYATQGLTGDVTLIVPVPTF